MAYIPLTEKRDTLGDASIKPQNTLEESELSINSIPQEIDGKLEFSLMPSFLSKKRDDTRSKKIIKAIGRFVVEPAINLAEDVSAYHVANELIKGVEKGEYPIELLEEFNKFDDTKKTNLQFWGDLFTTALLAVPGAKTEEIVANQLTQKSLPLLTRMGQGAISGLKSGSIIGGAFGLANSLSESSDPTPEEIVFGTGAGIVGGAIIGAGAEGLTPAITQGIKLGWNKSKGTLSNLFKRVDAIKEKALEAKPPMLEAPKEIPEPTLVQKLFPKLYEKELENVANLKIGKESTALSPKLNTFEKLISPFVPVRKLTEKDPTASFIRKELENGVLEQKRNYSEFFTKDWVTIKNADKELFSKAVGFQEAGRPIEEASSSIKPFVQAIRNLETQTFNFARDILKVDVGQWRFTPENHFSHIWTGNQVLFEEILEEGAKKPTRKTIAFAEDRIDGLRKLLEIHERFPNRKFILRPRTEINKGRVKATPLSQLSFFKFVNNIADILEVDSREALEEISLQGIARIKPGKTKVGVFEFRKGEIGDYTTDPTKVYPGIWYKMTKKAILDPILRKESLRLPKVQDSMVRGNLEDLINLLAGEFQDQALSYKTTSLLLAINARMKLGYRISPVIVNDLQRLYGIATSGTKNFTAAQRDIFTEEGQKIIKKLALSTDVLLYEARLTGLQPKLRVYDPLYFFGKSEGGKYVGTRNTVGLANYYEGLTLPLKEINANMSKLKLPKWESQEELAIDFARQATHATQFVYGLEGIPDVMRSNLGRYLGQFKSYGLNLISNMPNVLRGKPLPGLEHFYPGGLTKQQALRQAIVYFGTMFTQGGIRALGFGLERFLPAATLLWMALHAPALLFGVASFLGVDISSSSAVEFSNFSALLPYSDAKVIWEAINKKDPKVLTKLNPAAFRIYRAIEASADKNFLKDFDTGRKIMRLTPIELGMYATGLTPLRVAQEAKIHQQINRMSIDLNELSAMGKRDIIAALKNRDFELASNIYKNLTDQGVIITSSELTESIKKSELTRIQRDFLSFRKNMRGEFLEWVGEFIKR